MVGTIVGLALAAGCSSSSSSGSSGGPSSGSLAGTWCPPENASPQAASSFTFTSGSSCAYAIAQPPNGLCSMNATCSVNGDAVTITTPGDGGAMVCSVTLTFSNGGQTLEVKSDGGQQGCPSFDAPGLTQSGCSFGCASG